MPKIIDRRTIDFLIFDVFNFENLLGKGRYADHDRESVSSVLDLAEQIANKDLWPHSAKADIEEPYLQQGQVKILPEAIAALNVLREAGFFSAHVDYALGGMQLPVVVNHACNGMFKGASVGTQSYMGLTRAAANLLKTYGSEALQWRYMKPMLEGRFFGTMCLSEPDAGSSLADTQTGAIANEDGSYNIIGSKMWISGGDHNAAENIIHLVLARTPDAAPGAKGLSLFAVPKFLVNDDGSTGDQNGITVAGLNHKMGYRGTSNCLLIFGEAQPALGQLVGELGHGLFAMFHMMNESRISVGIGAAMISNVAYRLALEYAKERKQGRRLADRKHGNDSDQKPVAIIEHPDVRRMLLRQKAFSEGAMALCLYAGTLVDREILAVDASQQQICADLLEVFTPVVKAWSSEFGLEANKLAIQVLGGYGYTRDFPVERLYRDNRLNMIHEGTNGIQALDLLGRKLVMDQGRALKIFNTEIRSSLRPLSEISSIEMHTETLGELLHELEKCARSAGDLISEGKPSAALANATPYLHGFGHLVVGWLWLQQAATALKLIDDKTSDFDRSFLNGKITACHYFFEYEIPEAQAWVKVFKSGTAILADLEDDGF